jgi:hypothetical protein
LARHHDGKGQQVIFDLIAGMGAPAAVGPIPITYVDGKYYNAPSGTTVSPLVSSSAQAGDLGIFITASSGTTGKTWTPPSGWTEVQDSGAAPNSAVFYKILTAGDIGNPAVATISSSGSGMTGVIVVYRNANYNSKGVENLVSAANGTTAVSALALATLVGKLIVYFSDSGNASFTTPSGLTKDYESIFVSGTCKIVVFSKDSTVGAGQAYSSNVTNSSSHIVAAMQVQLTN